MRRREGRRRAMRKPLDAAPRSGHLAVAAPLAAQGRASMAKTSETTAPRMSEGQRTYEARRAAKAGKTLEQWLKLKAQERDALLAAANAKTSAVEPKKQGFFARLMAKVTKPL
jgi:hypothetical protein